MNDTKIKKLKKVASKKYDPEKQGRCRHFAFILRRNKIIATSMNRTNKTCSFCFNQGFEYGFPHAEISVLKKCPSKDFSKLKLVIIRLDRNNKLLYSKPCKKCSKIINRLGFKEIIYSDKNGSLAQ